MNQAETNIIDPKIGQLFFIGISGHELDADTRNFLTDIRPGGICLFARNIRTAEQTRKLTDDLRGLLGDDLLIGIDQEGGLVDRLRRILEPMPPPASIKTSEQALKLGELAGRALRILGINVNFAPVVDVIDQTRLSVTNGLYSRNFGTTAAETVALAGQFLAGLERCGIIGCLKHFPGLGASRVDSHEELPVVDIDAKTLWETDLLPYRVLLPHTPKVMIMTAHCLYPNVDLTAGNDSGENLPASINPVVINNLLRDKLGFHGLAITDDLEMGAITRNFSIGEACVRAIAAGEDMLAVCAQEAAIREGVLRVREALESGLITKERVNEARSRIISYSNRLAPPESFSASTISDISEEIRKLKSDLEKH